MKKAAIISVGSELLSGQILNRNAPWLSAKLFNLGIDTCSQVTVDDRLHEIIAAMNAEIAKVDCLFLTGGLGPTSDDITRNAVAECAGAPLVYHSLSWDHVVNVFSRGQMVPPEANRQQCFFPKGSTVLENIAGTANAFCLEISGCFVVVLPGPPKEIEAIWQEHLQEKLAKLVPVSERKVNFSWRTIGRGESFIAEIIECLCAGTPDAGKDIDIAYRAHAPLIETKIRINDSRVKQYEELIKKISSALSPWLYESQEENVPQKFCEYLFRLSQNALKIGSDHKSSKPKIAVYDLATQGHLSSVLAPIFAQLSDKKSDHGDDRIFPNIAMKTVWPREALGNFLDDLSDDLALVTAIAAEGWIVALRYRGQQILRELPLPFPTSIERNNLAIACLSCKHWFEMFDSITNSGC